MSTFVPPLFSKIGKNCSDLLAKKWDAKKDEMKHQLNVASKADNGVSVTSTAFAEDSATEKLSGKVVVKKEDKTWGEAAVTFSTSLKSKFELKLTKLVKGLTVSSEAEATPSTECCKVGGKATAEYVQNNATGSVEYDHNKSTATASLSTGFDGLTVGGQLALNTKKPKEGAKRHEFLAGVQYAEGDLTFALATEKDDAVAFSALHKLSKTTAYGVRSHIGKEASLAFGGEYAINTNTTTKAKIQIFNNKEFFLAGFLQHKLADPKLTVAFSSQWAPLASSRAKDNAFAVNISLGDA